MDLGARIVFNDMRRVYTAIYDAEHKLLRLTEPLEGVEDGAIVQITIALHREDPEPTSEAPHSD
jgi:hypothetical protein